MKLTSMTYNTWSYNIDYFNTSISEEKCPNSRKGRAANWPLVYSFGILGRAQEEGQPEKPFPKTASSKQRSPWPPETCCCFWEKSFVRSFLAVMIPGGSYRCLTKHRVEWPWLIGRVNLPNRPVAQEQQQEHRMSPETCTWVSIWAFPVHWSGGQCFLWLTQAEEIFSFVLRHKIRQ